MPHPRGKICILACESGRPFAEKVYEVLKAVDVDVRMAETEEIRFANTEVKTVLSESIRGEDVFIFQDVENSVTGYSVDENLRALLTAIDAVYRCDANYITAVVPTFPYARQDKQETREGITAVRVAMELENCPGASHVLTFDVHNKAIQGFFRKARFDNLAASFNLINYFENSDDIDLENTTVISTDIGGAKRADYYARQLKTDIAFTYKKRNYGKANSVEDVDIMGELDGRDVLIIDDMICTAGTLTSVARTAKEKGAQKVVAACSLPLFNGEAIERIKKSCSDKCLDLVVGTDAVYHGEDFVEQQEWFVEVSVAEYFAEFIMRLNQRKQVSDLLE